LLYKRKQYPDFTTLYQFLNSELPSILCLNYKSTLIRAFNAIPSDIKLDVYIDEILLARELEYKQFSYSIAASTLKSYNVKIFVSSQLDIPIIDTQIQIPQGNIATLAIVGSIENPNILIIKASPPQQFYSDRSLIRYVNLVNSDLMVNIMLSKNIVSSKTVKSNEYSLYEPIVPGLYQFQFILDNNSVDDFKTSTNHELKATRIYTFYLIGNSDVNSDFPIELVISVDVITVIKSCPPNIKN